MGRINREPRGKDCHNVDNFADPSSVGPRTGDGAEGDLTPSACKGLYKNFLSTPGME